MNIIMTINGGMGKSVFATAVCRAIKRWHPNSKLIVVTGYPDVFSGLDSVDMAFHHGQEAYFYQKYIENQEVMVFAQEPYMVTEHIQSAEHIIESWCRLVGVPYSGEMPEVFINQRERLFYQNKYSFPKETMILQTNGGGAGPNELKYSWARDMPAIIVEAIIREFSNNYQILHIRKEEQIPFEGTTPIQENYKGIAYLIERSSKRVLIDSVCQHIAAALGKKSTVLWVANKPNVFGYSLHDNIVANPETIKPDLRNSFLGKYNIGGAINEFPYRNEKEIFNIDRIIESINQQ